MARNQARVDLAGLGPDDRGFLGGPRSRVHELRMAFRILAEFVRGFRALHFVGPCVTVFGSARFRDDHRYYGLARELGADLFVVLTDAEAGKTLQVAPQTVIELRLPENPTTGFRWIVTAEPEDCAVVQGDSYERPTSTAIGAGRERRLLLRSAGAVRCELVLTYRRSWEPEDQAARSLRYVLVPPG